MASFKRLSLILLTSCASLGLAACDGASSVASPGEGGFPAPAPAPAPAPTPTPTPTPTAGTPAATCPTNTGQALTDTGVIGNYRVCRLPTLVSNLTLPGAAQAPGVAYEINGRVDVGTDRGTQGLAGSAGSLTIGAGALLFANTTNTENDFLIVNRGSTINAQGTATAPIIFTAQANLTGTLPADDAGQGLWGGVILAGRAPVANCTTGVNDAAGSSTTCENVVEGTGNALYGGNAAGDSSGVFQYVQIRYSGTVISPNNELQGLTLAGTGSGTTISNVQIHNSSDDGIELFGGTANLRNIVITGADDDSLDFDQGWRGLVQFLITAQKPNNTTQDNFSMEIDSSFAPSTGANPEDALPRTFGRISNATFIHTNTSTSNPLAAIRLRGSADLTLANSILVTPGACLLTEAGTADRGTIRPANAALQDQGPPRFNSIYFACGTQLAAQNAVNQNTITTAEQAAFFTTDPSSGNTTNGTAASAVQNGFYPTATTLAVAPFAVTGLNPANSAFFTNTTYIGAVSGPNDTWFQGWTCNSNRATFGTTSRACSAL